VVDDCPENPVVSLWRPDLREHTGMGLLDSLSRFPVLTGWRRRERPLASMAAMMQTIRMVSPAARGV